MKKTAKKTSKHQPAKRNLRAAKTTRTRATGEHELGEDSTMEEDEAAQHRNAPSEEL